MASLLRRAIFIRTALLGNFSSVRRNKIKKNAFGFFYKEKIPLLCIYCLALQNVKQQCFLKKMNEKLTGIVLVSVKKVASNEDESRTS